MRPETILAWIFGGFGLLTIGTLLDMLGVAEDLSRLLQALGVAYFSLGLVLAFVHSRHMENRMRAGRESHRPWSM